MKKFKGWGALWCNEVGFNNTNLHAHVLFNGPYIDQSTLAEMGNQVSGNEVVRQNHTEKAKLLKMVLSNCAIDAVSLSPTYRKPFDLIFQRVKTDEWCARGDSNSRPSGS